MSEHDEPKAALTRLIGEHLPDYRRDIVLATCECGWSEASDPTGKTWAEHFRDVLLAEGYTTSPAPDRRSAARHVGVTHGVEMRADDLHREGAALPKDSIDDMARLLIATWERVEDFVTASQVASFADLARVALAASPAPEATETVEWNVIRDGKPYLYPWLEHEDEARDYVEDDEEVVKRTRISYADRVAEWVPVDRAVDEHEGGGR